MSVGNIIVDVQEICDHSWIGYILMTQAPPYHEDANDSSDDDSSDNASDDESQRDNHNEISLLISNDRNCCESWNAKIYINGSMKRSKSDFDGEATREQREQMLSIKEKLIGQIITYIGFDVDARFRHISDEHRGTSITIRTEDNEIVLVVDNIHNGYYSHRFIAKFDGRVESGDL